MLTPNHEPQSTILLPVVGEHVKHAIAAEFADTSDLILETYYRMMSQQPELTNMMANYIEGIARDDSEKIQMMRTMALTYRMLEAQAEANQLETDVNGSAPENSQR